MTRENITRSFVFTLTSIFAIATLADEPTSASKKKQPAAKKGLLLNGKDLAGWKVIDKYDFEKHGKVTVEKGVVTLGRGKPATGIAYQGKLPRMNYEMSLDAKRVEGDDFFCGLTFPVGKNYCTLIVGGWGGGVTGLSNVDTQSAVENETTGYTKFKQNQWYHIRLKVTDKKIEAWIDKEQIIELDTDERKFSIWWEQEPVRPLGIATWNTKSFLRNIRLTRLNKKIIEKDKK